MTIKPCTEHGGTIDGNVESMPATLRKLLTDHPGICSADDERDSDDGYWAYCGYGWTCDGMGCGTIHEPTVREMKEMLATVRRATDAETTELNHSTGA